MAEMLELGEKVAEVHAGSFPEDFVPLVQGSAVQGACEEDVVFQFDVVGQIVGEFFGQGVQPLP